MVKNKKCVIRIVSLICLQAAFVFFTAMAGAGTINVPGDYATIQAAIDNASTGDTIQVAGGSYPETLTISTAGITLQGDGTYPKINPAATGTIISPLAANTTIRGFEICHATGSWGSSDMAIWDNSWTVGPSGLTVDDCIIHGSGYGVRGYGDDFTVTNCELYDLNYGGIHASGPSGTAPLSFTIQNNWCHDWHEYQKEGAGIFIKYDRRSGVASHNYVSGMRMGIAYYYGGPAYGGQLVIEHNTIDLDYDAGSGTVGTTMGISFWGTGSNADQVIVRDNIFANARWYAIYQEGAAISGSITVDHNLFFNNYFFYWPDFQYPYQWFGDDTRSQAGWQDGPADGFTFTNNISASDPMFQLSGLGADNHWKLQIGSPAMRAASDGANIGANQWMPPQEVRVDDDYTPATPGWGVDRFDTVAGGVSAVDIAGTVTVASGRYPEDVVIDKALQLLGENLPFLDGEPTSTGLAITRENVSISGLVIDNFDFAIDVTSSGTADIAGCYLFGNATGLRNQSLVQTVNALQNWWGDNSGPAGTGNPVTGIVNYDPWIGKTGDFRGAQNIDPGSPHSGGTGTGRIEVDFISNTMTESSLVTYLEGEGVLPQGYAGFAGGRALNRRLIVTPYYLADGQFTATIRFYYTQQDLVEAGIPEGSWLSVYVWDEGASKWVLAVEKNVNPASENIHQGDKAPDTVLGHYGTDTSGGYAWANVDHFSEFAAGQDPTVPVELSVFSVE